MKCEKTDGASSRRTLNLYTLLATVFLLMALQLSTGELSSGGVGKMTTDINRMLMQALEEIDDIVYQNHTPRSDYNSTMKFNAKGMGLLYNATTRFMKWILPNPTPNDLIQVKDGSVTIKNNDYGALAQHYVYYLVFLCILLVFAILMPFCGFCFCCCRCCCGNCGGRSKPSDKKGDLCKKIIYGTLLIGLGTLFLFGVVCAFVSNEHMQEGTEDLATNLNTGVNDASAYLTDTAEHINVLLSVNFIDFSNVIIKTLDNSTVILFTQLEEMSNATSMTRAQDMVKKMSSVQNYLKKMKELVNTLRVEASQLNDATRKIKRDLLEILAICNDNPECSDLKKNYVDKLGTDIDFNSIPDVTEPLQKLDEFNNLNLDVKIEEGLQKLENIKGEIREQVELSIIDVKKAVHDTGKKIETESKKVLDIIDDANKSVDKLSKQNLELTDKYIKEYSKYRYYVGIAVSCVLLLITLCIALGLVCGVCGKRPGSYNDDCCNKGAGGKFLILGVAIMFLTATLLVVILIVHSLGIFATRLVCEPMRNPEGSKELDFVGQFVDLEKFLGENVSLQGILTDCYANKSAYAVFHLRNKFDLNEIRKTVDELGIESMLEKMTEQMNDVSMDIKLLDDDARKHLDNLRTSGIGAVDFDKVIYELSGSFTTINLSEFSNQLKDLIENSKLPIVNDLKITKIHIDAYIKELVTPMMNNANQVIDMSKELNTTLRFGESSFEVAVEKLVDEIQDAEEFLKKQGPGALKNITIEFGQKILNQVYSYVDRTLQKFEVDVGNCGPLSLIIHGVLTSTCDKVFLPMNGFWFSIMWCIVWFIPTIIISVKLASLYQKFDPYPGSFVESEYLYDAYADRENIPLARGKHSKKKHKKKRSDGRYISETYEPGNREFPGGSHHADARYADMAPKHFEDYPNGGPPQYQRATEYERPPPYYYPGNGDQN